jgi:HlyD family secretion protein
VSGFVEGRSYNLVSTGAGTIGLVQAAQGDRVETGQELFRLDESTYLHLRDQAQAGVDAAEAELKAIEEKPSDEDLERGQAWVFIAESEWKSALAALDLLESSYAPLDPPDAELHRAQSAVSLSEAGVDLAKAQLNQIEAGPPEGQRRMAEAKLKEAQSRLKLIEWQLEELSLRAPASGIAEEVLVREGEIVTPGTPLARIMDPNILTVKVYVPEAQVASLKIGQKAEISADAYPGETFDGSVRWIADRAQFTPTLVLTEEERVKLVFEVEVLIEGGLDKLKAGMPVDVVIQP